MKNTLVIGKGPKESSPIGHMMLRRITLVLEAGLWHLLLKSLYKWFNSDCWTSIILNAIFFVCTLKITLLRHTPHNWNLLTLDVRFDRYLIFACSDITSIATETVKSSNPRWCFFVTLRSVLFPAPAKGNHWSFCLHVFAFSRHSYEWNRTVSLFLFDFFHLAILFLTASTFLSK